VFILLILLDSVAYNCPILLNFSTLDLHPSLSIFLLPTNFQQIETFLFFACVDSWYCLILCPTVVQFYLTFLLWPWTQAFQSFYCLQMPTKLKHFYFLLVFIVDIAWFCVLLLSNFIGHFYFGL
jgi:hypothetical protein